MSIDHEIIRLLFFMGGVIAFIALNAAYLVWVERKVAAHIQRRVGPKDVGPYGLLQPLADGVKLMTKQLFAPDGADPILYRLAPVMILVPAVMSFVTIPFADNLLARDINLGLLMIFAFASVGFFGVVLGAWGSRNKYAIIAACRVVSQNIAYEIPLLITLVTMIMVTSTMNLQEIVVQQQGAFWNWNIFQLDENPLMPVSFLIFFICILAETNRAPFDMAEAESELVAGVMTEYPGMGFGVFFMGEYANIVIGACISTILFFGGWHCPFGVLPGVHWFLIKMYLLIFMVIWIRWTFPRTTFFSLLNLSWKVLIPVAFINLILTSAFLKVF